VSFAQKFIDSLFMTHSGTNVLHCTKESRACPILLSTDADSSGPRNPEKANSQGTQRDDGRLTLIK
jgi:hypothetical protein